MSMTPTPAPVPSFDASALLDSAELWRTAARTAIADGEWAKVEPALNMAETTYESAIDVVPEGSAIRGRIARGRALCTVLRSDVELRHWRLDGAEERLDEAYHAFKALDEGVIGAELWRVTARLAERQGRWRSAKAAWKRVVKLTDGVDEVALGDALIRIAEVEIVCGDGKAAEEVLERVEALVRDLDDDLLRSRGLAVRAAALESERNYAASWEAYQDAQNSVSVPPQDFLGLLKLRMAGTAVWMRPRQAFRLIERGYDALVSAHHPDALGLAYHQLAVLALAVRDADAAALATVGARSCRGGFDETSRPMLVQALRQGGHIDAADSLEAEEGGRSEEVERGLGRALEKPTVDRGLNWRQLGTEEGMLALCASLRRSDRSRAKVRVEGETGWLVDDHAALVRHRATLTWDAPVDTLGVEKPAPPVVNMTPRPVPRRNTRPTVPAATSAAPGVRIPVLNLVLAAVGLAMFVAFSTVMALLLALQFLLPVLR